MTQYHGMPHPDELDLDTAEDYLDWEEENPADQLDIIHLFGREKLETIQESLSKATGLAFITVNYKGDPITSATAFCAYCEKVRSIPAALEQCKFSDAFGSIQAATTQKTNVYFCPCGLLEVAIPIIVRGHYLGGFIGGQIRCLDAPDTVSRLSAITGMSKPNEQMKAYKHLIKEVPVYSYEKFLDIANLVSLVINQLSENEISQHVQSDTLRKRMHKVQALNQKYLEKNQQLFRRIRRLELQNNEFELLDMLTSLHNLTVIENAEKTNEYLEQYITYIKYSSIEKSPFVPMSAEFQHAEQYLQLQKIKMGERLEYSLQMCQELHMQKMPSHVLMPFVKNALYHGVLHKKEGGRITVNGYVQKGNVILEIEDNGPGFSDEELDARYEVFQNRHEGYYIRMGMEYARDKMQRLFGKEYAVMRETFKDKGSKSVLMWPEYYEIRTE